MKVGPPAPLSMCWGTRCVPPGYAIWDILCHTCKVYLIVEGPFPQNLRAEGLDTVEGHRGVPETSLEEQLCKNPQNGPSVTVHLLARTRQVETLELKSSLATEQVGG